MNRLLRILTLTLLAAALAPAATVLQFQIHTSDLLGETGSIYFDFNPGFGITDPATATVTMFASDGTLGGTPATTGDVTGVLPATVTLKNSGVLNSYLEGFTFGSYIRFLVTLAAAPTGTATSGSVFDLALLNASGDAALTTNPDGFLAQVFLNTDGATDVTVFPTTPDGDAAVTVTVVPEPSTFAVAALALAGVAILRRR